MPALSLGLWAGLTLGCVSPQPALDLCAQLPTMGSLSLLVEPTQAALLAQAQPTQGAGVLGESGMTALRSRSRCVLTQDDHHGAVTLERTRPQVLLDGQLYGERVDTLRWVVKNGTVDVGAQRALDLRESAQRESAQQHPDPELAAEAWARLMVAWPDPTLDIDLALAERAALSAKTRLKVTNTFHMRQGQEAHAELVNGSTQDLLGATVLVRFDEVDALEQPRRFAPPGVRPPPIPAPGQQLRVELGPVPAGGRLSYSFTLPQGSERFRLSTEEVQLK